MGRAELLDNTMMTVLNKANGTNHAEATTVLFELTVSLPTLVENSLPTRRSGRLAPKG